MRWTGRLLIVLALSSLGCFRSDWISETLTLVNVTGTWEGSFRYGNTEQTTRWVLQQNGPKVTGELSWSRGHGRVEGVVNGEVLALSVGIRAELAVDGDEMWGNTDDPLFAATAICRPCFLRFRRESSPVPAQSEPPARRQQ